MKSAIICTFIVGICACWGCVNQDAPPKVKEDFSCVKLLDEQGQDLGFYGCISSNDWTNIELTDTEAAHFSSTDIIPLTGTTPAAITTVAVYPNPVVQGGNFSFRLISPDNGMQVKVQLAIIDESGNVLRQISQRLDLNATINISVPPDKFDRGAFYRVYYRVSALNAPILFEGYGNIVVCKQPGLYNVAVDCI